MWLFCELTGLCTLQIYDSERFRMKDKTSRGKGQSQKAVTKERECLNQYIGLALTLDSST